MGSSKCFEITVADQCHQVGKFVQFSVDRGNFFFLSRQEYQQYFQRLCSFFFGNKYYLNEIDLVYSTDNKEKYSSRYNNIKTKTKSGHLISLRHFCFGVLLVRNPWSTLAFYFQSSLNWAVNYIPVLTIPPVFVAEFF